MMLLSTEVKCVGAVMKTRTKFLLGWSNTPFILLPLVLLLLSLARVAYADTSNTDSFEFQDESAVGSFGGPDNTQRRIASDRNETGVLFKLEVLNSFYDWQEALQKDHGLALGAEYNAVYITASDQLDGADDYASGGIFRFRAAWEAFARGSSHPGTLMVLVEHTDGYSNTLPNSFLPDSLGYVGISNIPYNDEGWRLNTLYWDQKFQDGKYEIIGGYVDISDYLDVYPLTSPWTDYFSYVFSIGAGALDLANDGALGFAGAAWLTESVYAMAGFVDQNSDATDPMEGFDTFYNDREYLSYLEIGWTGASQEAYFLNNIHVTLWQADERSELGVDDGWGGVFSFNHMLDDKWLAFVRVGFSEDGGSLLERSVSIGGGYTPAGIETLGSGSQLGFGVNWGRPNDSLFGVNLDDQYSMETYYRLQLTRELAITPSVQLLIDPALNPDQDSIWVGGVRARLAF